MSYRYFAGTDLVLFLHGLGCVKESFEGAWGRTPCPGFPCSQALTRRPT